MAPSLLSSTYSKTTLTPHSVRNQAAGGIGLEVAYTFAEAGARGLVLADVDYEGAARACEKARTLASSPEFRALAVKLDVADAQSVQETVDRTACEFGRIDYCVNCVGVRVALRA